MTVVEDLPIEFTIAKRLDSTYNGTVIPIVQNNPSGIKERFGIVEPICVNGYVTEALIYSEVNGLPEVASPNFLDSDTEKDRMLKALGMEWDVNNPKYWLKLWISSYLNPTASQWVEKGVISLIKAQGHVWSQYEPLNLLTQNIARGLGENSSIGISFFNAGFGFPQTIDRICIDIQFKQQVKIVKPDAVPIVVQGATVQQVIQYVNTLSGNATTTKRQVLDFNGKRVSGSVSNTLTSGTATIYLKYGDIGSVTPSATNADEVISPGQTKSIRPEFLTSPVTIIASAAGTTFLAKETYNA
jgi:hypothetical protein